MKNLLIAFLLAVFSLQGAVAAVGSDIADSWRDQGPAGSAIVFCSDADAGDTEGSSVYPTIEELSDYVAFDMPASRPPHQVALPASPPFFLRSTDLPRIKPPPRG